MGHVVGIVPARGGSKRVPLKNLQLLDGRPLISYTIEGAIASKVLDRVIVSTDHDGIAGVSREAGAEVPFRRPADISEDVETELVLKHVVEYLESQERYAVDAVVLLQPTSPFRKAQTLARCVQVFREHDDADSVVTVTNVEGYRPEWMLSLTPSGMVVPYNTPFQDDGRPVIRLVARQSFPTLFRQNGAVWVTDRDLLMHKNLVVGPNAYGVECDDRESFDIDTPLDLLVADVMMKQGE